MDRTEFYRILEMTQDDGHPHWPSKIPNPELVKQGKQVIPYLIEALRTEHASSAVITLAGIGIDALPALNAEIETTEIRRPVFRSLIYLAHMHKLLNPKISFQHLIELVTIDYEITESNFHKRQEKESIQSDAINILGLYNIKEAVPALLEKLHHHNYLCVCACKALSRIKDPVALEPLVNVLQDEQKFWVPRGAAAIAIGDFGLLAKHLLPQLERSLHYEIKDSSEKWDERAKNAVADSIRKITDPNSQSMLKGKGVKYEMWGIY